VTIGGLLAARQLVVATIRHLRLLQNTTDIFSTMPRTRNCLAAARIVAMIKPAGHRMVGSTEATASQK
jgi:hypothetical protein